MPQGDAPVAAYADTAKEYDYSISVEQVDPDGDCIVTFCTQVPDSRSRLNFKLAGIEWQDIAWDEAVGHYHLRMELNRFKRAETTP